MLKKPAVLLIEREDGKVEILHGEKGDIYSLARDHIRNINDCGNKDRVARVTGFGVDGVLKQHRWKPAAEPAKAKK